jgi:hypothetical protein
MPHRCLVIASDLTKSCSLPLWANIQGQELANRSVKDLGEMVEGVRNGFRRVRSENWLLQSFLTHAGLSLD